MKKLLKQTIGIDTADNHVTEYEKLDIDEYQPSDLKNDPRIHLRQSGESGIRLYFLLRHRCATKISPPATQQGGIERILFH